MNRYSGKQKWRTETKQDGDVMEAVHWKTQNNNRNSTYKTHKTNANAAPEAQLIQFSSKSQNYNSGRFQMKKNMATSESTFMTIDNHETIPVTISRDVQYLRKLQEKPCQDSSLLGITMKELIKRADALERRNDRQKRQKLHLDHEDDTTSSTSTTMQHVESTVQE